MITYQDLSPHFLHSFDSESDLLKSIEKIKAGFTTNREDIEKYVLDKKLVSAYLAIYASTNIAKYSEIIDRLPQSIQNEIASNEFIDMGSGPATFSFAHLKRFPESKVKVIDKSALMLDQARSLLAGHFSEDQYEISKHFPKNFTDSTTLFFGHSINEMGVDFAIDKIKQANANIVMFIEPGTKDFFEMAKVIRAKMIELGYGIQYPCTHYLECPVTSGDWCHQYIKVNHHQSIERLCQLAQMDRRNLPVIAHVYTKKNNKKFNALIMRVLSDTKHMQPFILCNEAGELIHFEASFRGLSKSEIKELTKLQQGTQVNFSVEKELSETHFRGKISI